MKRRPIKDKIHWLGTIDWDRRLFDSLIPLPDGTSYTPTSLKGAPIQPFIVLLPLFALAGTLMHKP